VTLGGAGETVQHYMQVSYDTDTGELTTTYQMLDQEMKDIVRVRAELQEKVLRQACVYELEKLGYRIYPPDTPEETAR
jgi:hypothetical protein